MEITDERREQLSKAGRIGGSRMTPKKTEANRKKARYAAMVRWGRVPKETK